MKKKHILYWALGGVAALAVAALLVLDVGHWATLDMDKLRSFQQSTVVLDGNGQQAALLSGSEKRILLSLDEIPPEVQNAFIAAEDARFYRHPGVDFYRIGGAIWANIKSGDYDQGASTITQQLIKLTHLSSVKTLSRKAQEAWLAMQLERRASKQEILEMYLNVVYFGKGAYGIEAASRAYFGVPASELTLAQGALLAGVIKSPSKYAPHLHPDNAVSRRNLVLDAMLEQGFITKVEADSAKNDPLVLAEQKDETLQYAWYVDQAAAEAEQMLGIEAEELLSGGYTIYTALNPQMQKSAQDLFADDSLFPANAGDGTPAQAALICEDVQTGEVLSVIGGRKYEVRRGLNRAVQMKRQPGSTFKPISVYAAAIDRYGYLPVSIVDDTQRDFGGGYQPRNVNDSYNGLVTLRQALSRSLNAATLDLLTQVGVDSALDYARRAGLELDARDENNLSIGLGSLTYGVSPAALDAAYAPLANGGASAQAHLIRKIVDAEGRTVYEYQPQSQRVMSAESAYLITDMLQTAAATGSAKALNSVGFPVAGKTGTVSMENGGNRDAWTVAYTPRVSVAVWMGFDDPGGARKLPDAVGGSGLPARLAAAFLKQNADDAAGGDFPMPSGLKEALIDGEALKTLNKAMLISEYTPRSQIQTEIFPTGKLPTEVSDVWRKPTPVYDLSVDWNDAGQPLIFFTAVQSDAQYNLYRTDGTQNELIATLSGEPGDRLSYADAAYNSASGARYYVLPVNAPLLEEGKTLEGEMSSQVAPPQRRTLLNWFAGSERQDDPSPAVQAQPLIEEKPLF